MPVREKARRSPDSPAARPFSRPSVPQNAAKLRGFSRTVSAFTAETDCLLEESGFEPLVPLQSQHNRRSVAVPWYRSRAISWRANRARHQGGTASSNPACSSGESANSRSLLRRMVALRPPSCHMQKGPLPCVCSAAIWIGSLLILFAATHCVSTSAFRDPMQTRPSRRCRAGRPAPCSLPGASSAGSRGRARSQPGSRRRRHRSPGRPARAGGPGTRPRCRRPISGSRPDNARPSRVARLALEGVTANRGL